MKPIKEIYTHCEDTEGYFIAEGDYLPLLESMGQILVKVDDHDYSGDSRVLYKDGDKYGILIFGWGSCSGCDALQGCDSFEEIEQLRTKLFNDIRWFAKEEVLNRLEDLEYWKTQSIYWCDDEKMESFLQQSIEAVKNENH
jgi:hypothetical protein